MARLLITNDDGAHSPGIHATATALVAAGHDVILVAPSGDRSGWGAAIGTLNHGTEVHVEHYEFPGEPDIDAWALDGPPALCVFTTMLGAFGDAPDLVVSGSNNGCNCGRGVLQSGTVGAAMIAQDFGVSALAISQDDIGPEMLWSSSAAIAVATVAWLLQAPRKTVVNVNVPNLPLQEIEGAQWGRLAAFGTTKTSLLGSPPGPLTVSLTPREVELKPDTDTALVAAGFVSVTGLTGFRAELDQSPAAADAINDLLAGARKVDP